MIKKSTTRDIIRAEAVRAAARMYSAENYRRWTTTKVYGNQIQAIYKTAYKMLADNHPKMTWLQTLVNTPSKDLQLKLVLRIPEKDIEIDLPDSDRKLGAVAHGGGKELLLELLQILQKLGRELNPTIPEPEIDSKQEIQEVFNEAQKFMENNDESLQKNEPRTTGGTL